MKPHEKVKEVLGEMEQIGGVPTPREFYNEFDFRLRSKLFEKENIKRQDLEELTVDYFNKQFDSLNLYEESYTKVIELLVAVMHNPKIQEMVTDMYLEHKGYDIDELEERGRNFLNKMIKRVKDE